MRGIYTPVTKVRRQVFCEVAKFALSGAPFSEINKIPYKIVPGEVARYRDSVFKERAIVGERVRLALGLDIRPQDKHAPLDEGIEKSAINEAYYHHPLINIIKFACEACPENSYYVTDNCRGCLAHPCVFVCPTNAVSIYKGKSVIDDKKCIRCSKCSNVCPYNAIVHFERPCAKACGVNAISSDDLGRADIDYDKCVACGMCLVNCPFAAISDKSQIFQLINAMNSGEKIICEVAPAFVGQFGENIPPEKIKSILKEFGFFEVYEVAYGADISAVHEAELFLKDVPDKLPFLATSCCPSWAQMAKQMFPDISHCVSTGLTPMVTTARLIKKEYPDCKIVFIGPCSAKKLEAMRKSVRSDVDFVITFEEMIGMLTAKGIVSDFNCADFPFTSATAAGRGYAASGGVLDAILNVIKEKDPEIQIKTDKADNLSDCRKMLTLARAGKKNGYLLEGMACPGGCIGGAGTMLGRKKAGKAVQEYKDKSEKKIATEYSKKL